ncbi:hypothetical protein HWV62_33931 [Athelia sp. TMB]|nr:hypothetical protein HWV62_33931 [Athelia sp. TMB]
MVLGTQGSTFIYQSFLRPFFTANEAELDSTISSFQNSVVAFLQAKLSGLIDVVWRLVNKSGPSQAAPQSNERTTASGTNLDAALAAWRSYGPAILGGLSSGHPASASSTSLQPNAAPSAERRVSSTSTYSGPSSIYSGNSPAGTPDARGPPPAFPEPQHY